MPTCDECGRPVLARCVRCLGQACGYCDRCFGCGYVLCEACNTEPTPEYSYPGDEWIHPHDVLPLRRAG